MAKKTFFFVLLFLLLSALPTLVLGVVNPAQGDTPVPAGANANAGNYVLDNPLGNANTVQNVIENIIKALLGLVGVIALVMFILGGFKILTAGGDGKKVRTGLDTMLWATLGLLLIFASRILLTTILKAFQG
ncbi:MAG: pilin [Candidatus Komeilibacteria bacterium]|nr:pilin [Candidatus Komeilibacteria bacterium]